MYQDIDPQAPNYRKVTETYKPTLDPKIKAKLDCMDEIERERRLMPRGNGHLKVA